MTSNATPEAEAREFAAAFPTPNVRKAIELAEAGQVTWTQIRDLFARSLEAAR
jgi:hypothetical protein